jgi:hypothetical protein
MRSSLSKWDSSPCTMVSALPKDNLIERRLLHEVVVLEIVREIVTKTKHSLLILTSVFTTLTAALTPRLTQLQLSLELPCMPHSCHSCLRLMRFRRGGHALSLHDHHSCLIHVSTSNKSSHGCLMTKRSTDVDGPLPAPLLPFHIHPRL